LTNIINADIWLRTKTHHYPGSHGVEAKSELVAVLFIIVWQKYLMFGLRKQNSMKSLAATIYSIAFIHFLIHNFSGGVI